MGVGRVGWDGGGAEWRRGGLGKGGGGGWIHQLPVVATSAVVLLPSTAPAIEFIGSGLQARVAALPSCRPASRSFHATSSLLCCAWMVAYGG